MITSGLSAQNYLYNTQQFGIVGSMLGGAVTVGTEDASTVYYNPATIHKVTTGVDLSILQPQLNSFGFKNFWGNDNESSSSLDISLKPSLFSLKTSFKGIDLVFIKIGRSNFTDEFNTKLESIEDNIQSTQNFEYEFGGEDNWYGIGTSIELSSKLHVGFSQFVSLAKYSYRYDILHESAENSNPNQPSEYLKASLNSSYNNISLITKVGVLYDTEKHDIGLTVTTPTFLRLNKGGYFNQSRITINAGNTDISGIVDPEISPTIKTPWEFNFGYSFQLNHKRKLWISASYYTQITDYTMTEVESLGNSVDWINGNKSTYNFAIGYSEHINPSIKLSAGFRTNNFAYENNNASENTIRNIILDGNHIHSTLGARFTRKNNTILIGLDWGTLRNIPNEERFQNLTNNNPYFSSHNRNLIKNNISILFTYGFIIDSIRNRGKS